jgi:hypothetical protein
VPVEGADGRRSSAVEGAGRRCRRPAGAHLGQREEHGEDRLAYFV